MRAAVIFGPGASTKDLAPFQKDSETTWLIDQPSDSNQSDVVLVFGGDGTIHRHLEQLVKLNLPVLVVPCGSGNDFARALSLRSVRSSLAAWRAFSSGRNNVRTIDLGVITPLGAHSQNAGGAPAPHYFCCVGGVGLDAAVARHANRLPRWLRGHGGYVLSLLPALLGYTSIAMKVSVCDRASVAKPTLVAAFANAPTYGGGMKIAPRAQLDDGLLDVCVIREMNKFEVSCFFPSVYFGRHLQFPQVEYFQTEALRIETDNPADVYADGEYVCQTPIKVSVAKHALRVIVPPLKMV
jgi:YegS/Rv2252/BmrU family lipid kinase